MFFYLLFEDIRHHEIFGSCACAICRIFLFYFFRSLNKTSSFILWQISVQAGGNEVDIYSTECGKLFSISVAESGRYKKTNSPSDIEYQRNPECLSMCITQRMGFFNENEGFNVDVYIKTAENVPDETVVRQRFEKCAKEIPRNANNMCQWYSDGTDCLRKELYN